MLNKVQRLSCLSITGAIKSTTQANLEVILDIPPLNIFIKNIAKSIFKLKESGEFKHDQVGHGTMIGSNLLHWTDYLLPKMNFGKTFKTGIKSREKWAANSVIRDYAVYIFTDG